MNEDIRLSIAPDAGRFDPESAEASWTLPAEWYFDPEIYRQEHEAIFYRSWSYHCAANDLPNPGDYVCGSIADQEIFLIRGRDGKIRGFYNVCSHRAHPLLEGQGNTKLIVCPYHQWCYQADGCFRGARGKEALRDWIPENADLKPVRVEEFAGLLFANLDPDATPLAGQTGVLRHDLLAACPALESLHRVRRLEREVRANWKTIVDNNHECYHCAVNHPSLMEVVDYASRAVWSDDGITFSHRVEGDEHLNRAAYMLSEGKGEQGSFFGYVWPTTIPLFFPGPVSLVLLQVIPTGPETTRVRHDFYVGGTVPDAQEQALLDWVDKVLAPEDLGLCERVQRGLRSRGYRQGKFVVNRADCSYSEHHVHFFQRMVHDALRNRRGEA